LIQYMKNGEILGAIVLKANRGGLLMEINKVQGFMPASQLNQEHYPKVANGDKNEIMRQLQILVNKKLKIKIIDVDPQEQKLIVSEKALEQDKIKKVLIIGSGPIVIGQAAEFDYSGSQAWISMGQEKEAEQRIKDLRPYQVNSELIRLANENAIFMHCLPAYRGFEVTAEIIDGPKSIVWDQAENRLHIQKAILLTLIKQI